MTGMKNIFVAMGVLAMGVVSQVNAQTKKVIADKIATKNNIEVVIICAQR